MLAVTVIQRFLSIILPPTPFADPILSASSSFVPPLPSLVVTDTLAATPLIPAVPVTVVDVKADAQETLIIPAIVISTTGGEEESQDLSVYEEDDSFWELSSEQGSDITSSVTSDDMAGELGAFCTFHANVSIENLQLYPSEDDSIQNDEDRFNSNETGVPALPACTAAPTFVASAVPRRVYDDLQEEKANTSTPEPLQIAPGSIDDLDEIVDFKVEWLTSRALAEARSRSRKIQRTARMRGFDLVKIIPLKAHEHPAPQSSRTPSVLKDLGRSSRLRNSFDMDDLEAEERKQEALERSWADEEEDGVPDLEELKSFFKKRA